MFVTFISQGESRSAVRAKYAREICLFLVHELTYQLLILIKVCGSIAEPLSGFPRGIQRLVLAQTPNLLTLPIQSPKSTEMLYSYTPCVKRYLPQSIINAEHHSQKEKSNGHFLDPSALPISCCQEDHLVGHIRVHLPPPVGWLGFWDFSISAIISSKAFVTLVFSRALASVKPQLNSSASFRPSSTGTCLCSGLRSLLLPTMTSGTQSAPWHACQR